MQICVVLVVDHRALGVAVVGELDLALALAVAEALWGAGQVQQAQALCVVQLEGTGRVGVVGVGDRLRVVV